jgi:hypothetical protein
MEVSGQFHSPAALPQRKIPWYALCKSMDGPQSRSECGGEEKNSQPLPGLETSIIHPVAQRYTTELCWLLIKGEIVNTNTTEYETLTASGTHSYHLS